MFYFYHGSAVITILNMILFITLLFYDFVGVYKDLSKQINSKDRIYHSMRSTEDTCGAGSKFSFTLIKHENILLLS